MKKIILEQLEKLKISYYQDSSKKWQIIAINKAIKSIESYTKEIKSGEQLQEEIKGIGSKIKDHINEIITEGSIKCIENKDLNEQYYSDFMSIVGVGKAKAKEWISKGINTIEKLKKEIKEGHIKVTNNIDLGLKYYDDLKERIPRNEINEMKKKMEDILKTINSSLIFEICGSYRRNEESSGDIDFLITHPEYKDNNKKYNYLKEILNELKRKEIIVDEMTKNSTKKFLGMCKIPNFKKIRRIDILYINFESFYSSIMYFTGNKYFNLYIRNKCLEKNYSLNEYYLKNLNDDSIIYLKNEKHIFEILNIPYLKPDERKFSSN